MISNNHISLSEIGYILGLLEGISIMIVVELTLVANLRINHTIQIVLMSGLFRLFLKQRPIPRVPVSLGDIIGNVLLNERDLDVFG